MNANQKDTAMIKTRVQQLLLQKQADENRRISYVQAAKESGVSQTTLVRLAVGTPKGVRLETLDQLRAYFGLPYGPSRIRFDEHVQPEDLSKFAGRAGVHPVAIKRLHGHDITQIDFTVLDRVVEALDLSVNEIVDNGGLLYWEKDADEPDDDSASHS